MRRCNSETKNQYLSSKTSHFSALRVRTHRRGCYRVYRSWPQGYRTNFLHGRALGPCGARHQFVHAFSRLDSVEAKQNHLQKHQRSHNRFSPTTVISTLHVSVLPIASVTVYVRDQCQGATSVFDTGTFGFGVIVRNAGVDTATGAATWSVSVSPQNPPRISKLQSTRGGSGGKRINGRWKGRRSVNLDTNSQMSEWR